jgi:hypothetical protein
MKRDDEDFSSRLTALEEESATLRTRLSVLEGVQPKKPITRRDDDRTLMTVFLPVVHPKHLPSDNEAAALLKMVVAWFPQLKFRSNEHNELESFRAAFAYICSLTKTTAPVKKYAASWWIDTAQEWARAAGVQGVIRSLFLAIIATGDVAYSFDDPAAIWLDPYRASGRAVDSRAWRKILNGSADLIAPTRLDRFMDHSIGLQRVQCAR